MILISKNEKEAFDSLKNLIKIGRIHLYKPIQIAEILYRDREYNDINLSDLDTYRTKSKKWRDEISNKLVGNKSSSSAKYQDDVFSETAMPPQKLYELGIINRRTRGGVEEYIYNEFRKKNSQMKAGLDYCLKNNKVNFQLNDFINLFWHDPGLRRSIDKIYEIIVFALFSTIVENLDIDVKVTVNSSNLNLLKDFEDFTEKVLQINLHNTSVKIPARIFRVGVANAADRGLDMWANFGLALQVKHLSLTEELAENISNSITADRIVIICKDAEKKLIVSILNQIGWKSKIQSIITEIDLLKWYELALRGVHAGILGDQVMQNLREQIATEFPSANTSLTTLFTDRNSSIL